jgi:hypothetical protein
MLWSDYESIFVVYPGTKRVEMVAIKGDLSIAYRPACLESVSLMLLGGL